ncbi:DUF2339 domain-containing protein [Acinetobacter sp. SAAs470]|uniref:DUF2339 domain-containing protein n=1 Tax=unclassified Acinetobacter TaxID=196816 RepID=UPI003977CF5B
MGIILLLRFAVEHWQFSLAVQLGLLAGLSLLVVLLGYRIIIKNRSFALALQALGLAALFLNLCFAYYSLMIADFWIASICFVLIMALTIALSLKQRAVELAIMAMIVAYIAPFTLPLITASASEFLSYYLVINIAVAALTTWQPWKFLNQIALLMTCSLAGGYAFIYGDIAQRPLLTVLVLMHAAIFIWLGFRFSQLSIKSDIKASAYDPILDFALIFAAPILAYGYLYLMYLNQMWWQAGLSLLFATVFAILYSVALKQKLMPSIAQCYLSLMQIFLVLIPPILLPDSWRIAGWAIEGLVIFIYALYQNIAVSRYLAIGLLLMAGVSGLLYLDQYDYFANGMYWILAFCYFLAVLVAYLKQQFYRQLNLWLIIFLAISMLSATLLLWILLQDQLSGPLTTIYTLLLCSLLYVIFNALLQRHTVFWGWLLAKWVGVIPLYLCALMLIYTRMQHGILLWQSPLEQYGVLLTGGLLSYLWWGPALNTQAEKEWLSLGMFSSLAFASLAIIPSFPYLSIAILPLIFCIYCYWQRRHVSWRIFCEAKMTLVLMMIWLISSSLLSTQSFQLYWMPVFNPFDLMSIAIFVILILILLLQVKAGLDQGIAAVTAALALLWLSSYLVLRALHVYLATPFNQVSIWSDATIQLSLTLLWVTLAFVIMCVASLKKIKTLWLFGGGILVMVSLKLVLFDLSHTATLMRVISFLAAGFVMLLTAYLAPMPINTVQHKAD